MRGVHRLYANGRMQIFCLMILFMALESLAVINLTRGGNELDSILSRIHCLIPFSFSQILRAS